jgi:hypothetical protein
MELEPTPMQIGNESFAEIDQYEVDVIWQGRRRRCIAHETGKYALGMGMFAILGGLLAVRY